MRKLNKRGFTIVELMISSAVFSLMLLVCLGAVIYLGRIYYKGITIATTSETNNAALDSLTQAIQYSGSDLVSIGSGSGWDGAFCMGSKKYSYKIGTQLIEGGSGASVSDQVFVLSTDPGCTTSSLPVPTGSQDQRELLKENMRLTHLEISTDSTGLTNVIIGMAYGGDPTDPSVEANTFNYDGGGTIVSCKDSSQATAFCATSYLSSSALRKVN